MLSSVSSIASFSSSLRLQSPRSIEILLSINSFGLASVLLTLEKARGSSMFIPLCPVSDIAARAGFAPSNDAARHSSPDALHSQLESACVSENSKPSVRLSSRQNSQILIFLSTLVVCRIIYFSCLLHYPLILPCQSIELQMRQALKGQYRCFADSPQASKPFRRYDVAQL